MEREWPGYIDLEEIARTTTDRPKLRTPDILDPETETQLIFSPDKCLDIMEWIVDNSFIGIGRRRVVTYNPIIEWRAGGIDTGPEYGFLTLRRKPELEEDFLSWGVTEKVDLSRIYKLSKYFPEIPTASVFTVAGIAEELEIEPRDVIVRKQETNQFITVSDFSVDTFPLGVIINEGRVDSPIALVLPTVINGNIPPHGRGEHVSGGSSGFVHVKDVLEGVLTYTELDTQLGKTFGVDSWASLTARFWLDNPMLIDSAQEEFMTSVTAEDYKKLERYIHEFT